MIANINGSNAIKENDWQKEIHQLKEEIANLNQLSVDIKYGYQHINHIKYAIEIVNAEYGIDLSIEIDKVIKRGEKQSIIEQIKAFKSQEDNYKKYKKESHKN